jgi:hypothetical protein
VGTASDNEDLWAWLHESEAEEPDFSGARVSAYIIGDDRILAPALKLSTVQPFEKIRGEEPPAGDWVWVLPGSCEPKPDCLENLLKSALANPKAEVIGALSLDPAARAGIDVIRQFGVALTGSGRLASLTDPGEVNQGQLRTAHALGVPATGMLVRTSLWEFLGGLNETLPFEVRGLDFGWRANLTGAEVIAEPDAEVTLNRLVNLADERAGGLALRSAHTKAILRPLRGIALTFWVFAAIIGFLIGKDFLRARAEFSGWLQWLTHPNLARSVRDSLATLPITDADRKKTKKLGVSVGQSLRHSLHLVAERLGEWVHSFSAGREADITLDDMIADDFTSARAARKIPIMGIGLGVTAIGALIATRSFWGTGELKGDWLLPGPDSTLALLNSYISSVPGVPESASPAWVGLLGVLSLIGRTDWAATALLALAVPLAWAASYRFARTLSSDHLVPALASAGYALLLPASGVLNRGGLPAVLFALLLPLIGYSYYWWRASGFRFRGAGVLSIWLIAATACLPLSWPLTLALMAISLVKHFSKRLLAQWVLVIASPALLLLSPWASALAAYPGRLLTGASPALRAADLPLLAALPPVWVLASLAVLALVALVGSVRRPGAGFLLLAGSIVGVIGVALSKLSVDVAPGLQVMAGDVELGILAGGLVLASTVLGYAGVSTSLRRSTMGVRHFGMLGITALSLAAILATGGWWVAAGQIDVQRQAIGELPYFMGKALTAGSRTLALTQDGEELQWALVTKDFPRLGASETYAWEAYSLADREKAGELVSLLASGAEDESLADSLAELGVKYVWLKGGSSDLVMSIANSPGFGPANQAEDLALWEITDASTAQLAAPVVDWTRIGLEIAGLALLLLLALPEMHKRTDAAKPHRGVAE